MNTSDLATIGLLIFLEGVLSIDNAVVLALLASKLPPAQQKRALTYGLAGALIFRFIALAMATYLMHWTWVKFVGGGYLVYVGAAHWFKGDEKNKVAGKAQASFWKTVILIELMDIAFAIDSILAAVAISKKFWVIYTGGIIGMLAMRFSAGMFMKLLKRFPHFEDSAYLLVLAIGIKLVLDGFHLEQIDFHSSSSPAFWIFWGVMLVIIAMGFLPKKKKSK